MTLANFALKSGAALKSSKFVLLSSHGRSKLNYSNWSSVLSSSSSNSRMVLFNISPFLKCNIRNGRIPLLSYHNNGISRSFAVGFPFRHDENLNAVRLLYNLPNYKNLLFQIEDTTTEQLLRTQIFQSGDRSNATVSVRVQPGKDWRKSVADFTEASYSSQEDQIPITHPKNEEIVEAVLGELKSLTDEELSQVIYHTRFFVAVPHSKDPKYQRIWQAFDLECKSRYTSWSLDHCFVVADLWYGLGLARLSEFHWAFVRKLFRRCDKLSKEHFIRFMFCLNLNRSIPADFSPYDLEYKVSKLGDQLTAEEVVILAMAFFKIQIQIRDMGLMTKLLRIVMNASESLDDISVSAASKFARYCCHSSSTAETIYDFQEKFIPEIPRLSITACTHICLTGTNNLSPHKPMIQKVVDQIQLQIADARLKELERIALASTMFNIDCENLLKTLAEELRKPDRADEIRKYGRCLPALLHYLSIKNIFIPDLISTVLSKTFRNTYYGKGKEIFQRELLCLDIAADIELPEYKGNRLEPRTAEYIMKKNMLWIKHASKSKISLYEKFLRGVIEATESVLGDKELFYACNVLPQHHTMAIVFCRDTNGELAKIPQYLLDYQPHEVKKIKNNSSGLSYHALMVCGRNTYLWKTKELTGQTNLQLRQARKLGYNIDLVYLCDWDEMADQLKFTKHIETIFSNVERN